MKNILSSLTKSEKNRILEMHKKSTSRHYLMEQKTSMEFKGSTPSSNNSWDAGEGFFNTKTNTDGTISNVMNYWDGGSGQSKLGFFVYTDPIGYEGGPIQRETEISFDYYVTVKAGDVLNLTFNANSSNGDNVTSETYSTRGPEQSDTIYGGNFTLKNLPENSTITITVNGDNINKLVIKTTKNN